jgi:hypothetical protein
MEGRENCVAEYIEREKAQDGLDSIDWYHANDKGQLLPGGKSDIETYVPFKAVEEMLASIPAADVQPVVACEKCKHNNACLTQAFVEDESRVPFDRSTFFCADGVRADYA